MNKLILLIDMAICGLIIVFHGYAIGAVFAIVFYRLYLLDKKCSLLLDLHTSTRKILEVIGKDFTRAYGIRMVNSSSGI